MPAGDRADGSKELVALADGYRESEGSWTDLLRDCARRGMRAPVLAVGDGALGFWAALREVFPDTREQRDWVHKSANVLAALPKSAHPGAKAALAEIWGAQDKRHAQAAAKRFAELYGAKFAKAVAKVADDLDVLLTFYDYPAEHCVHLRTSNPIESTFVTVRHRTRVTKGPGSRAAGLAMAFKLIEAAQDRWRAVNAPHLVALVRAGATFVNGRLVERPAGQAAASDMINSVNAISIRNGDTPMDNGSAHRVAMRYFDMWNTGDTTNADQILHPDWVDHAHPEATGPAGVKQAVQTIRAARPDLYFTIHSVLGDNDLIAVVGSVGQPQQATDSPGRLIWLIRLVEGLMAEMWTYQQNQPSR